MVGWHIRDIAWLWRRAPPTLTVERHHCNRQQDCGQGLLRHFLQYLSMMSSCWRCRPPPPPPHTPLSRPPKPSSIIAHIRVDLCQCRRRLRARVCVGRQRSCLDRWLAGSRRTCGGSGDSDDVSCSRIPVCTTRAVCK